MSFIIPLIIGLLSIIVPGFFLAFALLKKPGLPIFEIAVIGFIFGLIFPPTMIWLESYLIPFSPIFAFSNGLYNANVIILTIIGLALCWQQNVFGSSQFDFLSSKLGLKQEIEKDYKKRVASLRKTVSALNRDIRIIKEHEKEEEDLIRKHAEELELMGNAGVEEKAKVVELHREQERKLFEQHESEEKRLLESATTQTVQQGPKTNSIVWLALLGLMLVAFSTRMLSISTAPNYFEFDPYFDMLSTQAILTYGQQLLYNHAAWPTLVNGTISRIQPIVPYLEAYWYNLATTTPNASTINTTLLSLISSWYPPITAALLVFAVFMFIYHEYGEYPAIIGAALATVMPVLITTFIAGEQLLEPWGIFALFFFYASYILAVNNPKEDRFAILAGIAFASNFLGAHYYTVTAAVLAMYIILQGIIHVIKREETKLFYRMNVIVLAIATVSYLAYNAYGSALNASTPTLLGIPVIISFPISALIFIFVTEYLANKLANILEHRKLLIYTLCALSMIGWIAIIIDFIFSKSTKSKTFDSEKGVIAGAVVGIIYGVILGIFITPIFGIIAAIIQGILVFVAVGFAVDNLNVHIKSYYRYAIISVFITILVISLPISPLGHSLNKYIALSEHFTTPSSPLFMTVQEYAPTGYFTYNFGAGGFGLIGWSIGGLSIIVWAVLIVFTLLTLLAIMNRNSKASIMTIAAVWPLAIAGMIEVKYLPHFGVAYIIALCAILGELMLYYYKDWSSTIRVVLFASFVMLVLIEAVPAMLQLVSAASNSNCSSIVNQSNALGDVIYCNTVPQYWLSALSWMKTNVGPYGARVLSWWDYGDWINWFGNSNAVLRGDNAVALADYAAAAHYVFTPTDLFNGTAYNSKQLGTYMSGIQAKYILFDDQLVPKWGALDSLACTYVNQTGLEYAISQGKLYGQPFTLGTSGCEIRHDPVYLLIPLPQTSSVSDYCSFAGNSTTVALKGISLVGQNPINQSYCVPQSFLESGNPTYLLSTNGTKTNAIISTAYYGGSATISGQQFLSFMVIYAPNGPNGTITDAPSDFYNSTYYRGFFLGKLPGLTMVYPSNFTGINFINSTHRVVIYELNNFTGSLPPTTPKPSWIKNNYTIPG